ncbi:MAG: epoxyqueuosine reductase [Syntrophaceae bacterium]|nr:epoxyqueuosine reductase [Syntrophaceae bacterium]
MLNSDPIIDFGRKAGADLVGIAPAERFEGAPKGHKPEDILPGAKSVVAMAKRIPLSIVKSIPSPYYDRFGYHDLNAYLRELTFRVALFIEDQGFEAFPLDPSVDDKAREVQILQEAPEPKIKILGDFSHRHAIVAAGLGEFAASSMVVVPKFGPRIRAVSVITTAPLEPGPLLGGKSRFNICRPEACGLQCGKKCPARALPGDGTIDHFKCRNYRNPGVFTLEYFKAIAESKKTRGPAWSRPGGRPTPQTGETCGICIKVCPIGISL